MKTCSKCKESKTVDLFNKSRQTRDGLHPQCKACVSAKNKKLYERKYLENRKRSKEYYYDNKEKKNASSRAYYRENKEKLLVYNKEYYQINRKRILKQKIEYSLISKHIRRDYMLRSKDKRSAYILKNKERINKTIREWQAKKKKTDVNFRLSILIRKRMQDAIKRQKSYKKNKSVDLLGCSIQEYREYLQSLFTLGMTWENQGKWQIDHIIPCSVFNLAEESEQKLCFHYTNTQPLWAVDNLRKSNKLNWKG